jgi:hypothetical protein
MKKRNKTQFYFTKWYKVCYNQNIGWFFDLPITGNWRLHANIKNATKETGMSVKVTLSWFSSAPIFMDVLTAVKREMFEGKILTANAIKALQELLPLNDGEPFNGNTQYGPHTRIWFEAPSLSRAVFVAEVLEGFLWHEFSEKDFFFGTNGTGGLHVLFAGKSLPDLLESLETALGEAQQDLKGTRRFLPSKRIQRLRLAYEELYK